jgi:hypothetical protein
MISGYFVQTQAAGAPVLKLDGEATEVTAAQDSTALYANKR